MDGAVAARRLAAADSARRIVMHELDAEGFFNCECVVPVHPLGAACRGVQALQREHVAMQLRVLVRLD
eukprot:3311194-Prymnesium_polylepis.1